ncbi:MAG: hypothetical protein WCP79_07105 [Bacillota bacterium]
MNVFLLYELICAAIFILVLVIKKKFNLYLLLFIVLFFLLTYIIIPFFDLHLVMHRYIIRGISTVVAGALAYGVYKIDINRKK